MAFYSSLPGQVSEFVVEDDRVPQRINSNQRVVENAPRQVRPVVQDYYPAVVNPVYQPTFYQPPPQRPVVQVAAAPTLVAPSRAEKKCCTTPVVIAVLFILVLIAVGIGVGVYYKVENDKRAAQKQESDNMPSCTEWMNTYNTKTGGNAGVADVFQRAADKFNIGSISALFVETSKPFDGPTGVGDFSVMDDITTVQGFVGYLGYLQGSSSYNSALTVLCDSEFIDVLFKHKRPGHSGHGGSSRPSYGCDNIVPYIPMCY